jgi:hypothetical protein
VVTGFCQLFNKLNIRCDAEPGALADYILALLKHNVPESEMRNELAVQLDEFLEKGSSKQLLHIILHSWN